ncbi:MAG: polyisoprenoid-binding protein [Arcobacter sp.]|nr:polyisoprenoid-binding protein [Arcobacter sp.]
MKFLKLGLASVIASTALFAGTYNVDASHSNVGFKVKHMMISNVVGKFDTFNGSFEYDEKTKTLKSLVGEIDVNSINTENAKRDAHLKESDFFAAKEFNNIKFVLSKVEDDKAHGKLTLRGVTKDVVLDLENNGTVKDPWGNTRVGLALSGKINRIDYGLKYNTVLEAGGVAVDEIVKLDIQLEGILAK